ncbi:MAG TPA: hypothetical protein VHA09_00775 [Nitrososphaera sp.]|nr:hypothetical protein [Nitrososphaera sp.]
MTVNDDKHHQEFLPQKNRILSIAGVGAASGLVGSLAISALILLAERVAGLPIGTFYLMLVSAISQSLDYSTYAIAQGLLLHLFAGAVIGALLSAPFGASRKAYVSLGRLAPAYGLAAGALVWAALFLPVTYGTMVPLLQSLDGRSVVSQHSPVGTVFSIAVSDMLAMMDRIVYTALAFNMLFGLVTLVLTRTVAEAVLGR